MRLWGAVLTGFLLIASLLPLCRPAMALGGFSLLNERNHPELRWLELTTDHFRIVYHEPLEPWARDAASILERSHGPLCRLLDVTPRDRVNVYLSDQDQITNGLAIGWDYFVVWVPSRMSTRTFSGGLHWFKEVLIHEYTHILISEASRSWLGHLAFPLGLYPSRWLHEGVAQWASEPWSVRRGDRTVASAILDGSINRNPPGVPGRSRLLNYARGNARVRWLAHTYGDSTIHKLVKTNGRFGLYDYQAAKREALGKDASKWHDRFEREMISFYGERIRRGEPADSIGELFDIGLTYPHFVVAGEDSTIWSTGQQRRGRGESSLFRSVGSGAPERIISGSISGRPVPLDDGRVIVPRFHRVEHGSWVEDLVIWDPETGSRFITSGERAGEPGLLKGDRICALVDSPEGTALAHAPLPGKRGPLILTKLGRWPRRWAIHSLAASPDGERLIVSATEPDGRRGLLGIVVGYLKADTVRLCSGLSEERVAFWLDSETIGWTSYRSGVTNVRTASWPIGGRFEADSARTGLGTGAAVAGVIRDSLLTLDFTSRRKNDLRLIDPHRRPLRQVGDPVYPFPAEPAIEPEIVAPKIRGPFPYQPLWEVRSWGVIPLIGPQAREPAIGLAGLWAEPLLKHAWGGYFYSSAEQASHPDHSVFYLTTRWGPYLTAFRSSAINARRILGGKVFSERLESTGIALLSPMHVYEDPNISAWLNAYVRADSRRPRYEGRSLPTPAGEPSSWSTLQLGFGSGFLQIPSEGRSSIGPTKGRGAVIRLQAGLSPWHGAERFLRGSLRGFSAGRLSSPIPVSFWIEGSLHGSSGGLPPQEFIGLDADPSHTFINGWPGIEGTVFLRGWPRARAARYVAHANFETRFRVIPDLGFRGPGIGLHGGTLAPFLEAAHPWGGASAGLFDERTRIAVGLEGRFAARLGPLPVVPAVAWGHPLGTHGPRGSWSVRLTTSLPFSMPMRPRSILRSLLGGAMVTDTWGTAPLPTN